MTVDESFRRALEKADFGPLGPLYAPETVFDASVPGRRVKLTRPGEIVAELSSWWPTPGRLTRWDVWSYPSGVTFEFERLADASGRSQLERQRHFLQVRDGLITRHQLYVSRPQGRALDVPDPEARRLAERAVAGLGEIAEQLPLTHAGQSSNRIERVVLADGRRLVIKHLSAADWIAQVTLDDAREFALWDSGVLRCLPGPLDAAIVSAGRDGDGAWLVMEDVGEHLLGTQGMLARADSRRLLDAFAAMHRAFAGEAIDAVCPLSTRITALAPERIAPFRVETDYMPHMLTVGWEAFFDAVPGALADAVHAVHDDPLPLARALSKDVATLVHGDLRGANLGLTNERVIALDWGASTLGPPALDFAWYLFVNGWRIDATREELIDDFRAAEDDLFDEQTLPLGLLAGLCWFAPILAHELVESSDENRRRARAELDWWTAQALPALERF